VYWHAMGGVLGEAVNKMVDGFNKSQSQIQVEAIFQGTYDDALAKLKTALASNSAPALIQVYDIGLRFMQDSGEVVPMQQFIDAGCHSFCLSGYLHDEEAERFGRLIRPILAENNRGRWAA
jgi:ABC-type glycerol-3-phosphate transport system substrate-binding protein